MADASDVQVSADVWFELTPSDRLRNRNKPRPVSNIVLIIKRGALRYETDSDDCPTAYPLPPGPLRKREQKALAKATQLFSHEEPENSALELSPSDGNITQESEREELVYNDKLLNRYQ